MEPGNSVKDTEHFLRQFRFSRIVWPVLIGVAVGVYAVYQVLNEGINPLTEIEWTTRVGLCILLGFGFMFLRDAGYVWRLRLLTDKSLSWRSAIEVALLWEFASALTPSVVGGSALAFFMLMREKISAGRSTAIVFLTIFLDELFYIFIVPVVVLTVGPQYLFGPVNAAGPANFGEGLVASFWFGYGLLALYTALLAFGLFVNPKIVHRFVVWLVSTRLFRRWEKPGRVMADELMIASNEFRTRDWRFWAKAILFTFFAWLGRYLVLNAVLAAFSDMSLWEHTVAFGRQAVMFIIMLIAPTPGGSGIAEGIFAQLFREFSPEKIVLILATLWRLISYYPYLFIGIPLLPRWLRRVFPPRSAA
jgi:hypothetical protein